MIWDFIRDFIVENITGGYNSSGVFKPALVGWLYNAEDGELVDFYTGQYPVIDKTIDGSQYTMYFGDWLATTLTTIIMCMIVAFAIWLVIWVFKMVAHAFLLRR